MGFAFLDHPGPIPFAHRGGAGEWPENTMPAFEGAVRLGFRYVETDVHATSDGALLAFHDDVLDRVTDHSGEVAKLPWEVVRKARVGGREPILLLEELLGTFPDLRVNIDPKHDAAVAPLIEVIEKHDAIDRVCIGSFSDKRVGALQKALGPTLCTAMGPSAVRRLVVASRGVPMGRFRQPCAQVPLAASGVTIVTERFVHAAHKRGIAVHVWTIDDDLEMERLLDLGVDGIMTDHPAVLRAVLERREQWVE
ncbi:MAG TPA: glycerophosphodiester phosphodiesterase [Acidimicrobiales bacterium]|nr:glycerophosphodiester phosphodiesterase [Acidimicrobiales bacterium]